jgi:hypothetical protein
MDYGKKVLLILIILILGCEHKKFKNPSDPNNIPPAPILISPANDSLIPENPPLIIRWEVKEDSNNPLFGEPIESKLELATNQNFTPEESIITDFDAFDPHYYNSHYAEPLGDSNYYWRVSTRYVGGIWSDQSQIFSFRVKLPIIYDTSYSGRDIAVKENYLFFADNSYFLRIFDITNPALPINVKKFDPPGFYVTNLFIKDQYLYTLKQSSPYMFSIIDINDPLNPQLLTNLNINYPKKLWVEGSRAYILKDNDVTVFDVANPESVYVADSVSLPISVNDFAVNNNYIYLLSDYQFVIFDLNSDSIISYLDISNGQQFCLEGHYVYIIGQDFNILDITNPYQPAITTTSDIAGDKIYKNNNTICIVNAGYYEGNIKVFDASDIRNLVNLGEIRYYFTDLVIFDEKIITISPLTVFKLEQK